MKSFKSFLLLESSLESEVDVTKMLDDFNIDYTIEDDYKLSFYITFEVKTKAKIEEIISNIHSEVDFDVYQDGKAIDDEQIDIDDEDEVDIDDVSEDGTFTVVIYLDNMDNKEEEINEAKRTIRVTHKGKRRIKMVCRRGFKWSNKKCVKISGRDRLNKKRAIRKALRTKKAKGAGYRRRITRLRNKAMKKRKGMVTKR